MTTMIRYGVASVDLTGAAEGAIRRYGLIRPDATQEFAELMAKDFDAFCTRAGPLRSNKHLFTQKALADISQAIKVLQGYVSYIVWISYFDGSEELWSKQFNHVRFRASVKECCLAARRIDGLLLRREERFKLALPECDAQWCSCRWLQENH